MTGLRTGLGVAAFSLAVVAVICIAVGWWVAGDPWYVFGQLAHSYHSCVRRPRC
jgi:hypothetical protein